MYLMDFFFLIFFSSICIGFVFCVFGPSVTYLIFHIFQTQEEKDRFQQELEEPLERAQERVQEGVRCKEEERLRREKREQQERRDQEQIEQKSTSPLAPRLQSVLQGSLIYSNSTKN